MGVARVAALAGEVRRMHCPAFENRQRGLETSAGPMSPQLTDGFYTLAQNLARETEWSWLAELAAMLREIHHTCETRPLSEAVEAELDRHRESGMSAAENASETMRRIVERYRALVNLNTALAKSLAVIRAGLAHIEEVPAAIPARPRRGLPLWQERRAKAFLVNNLSSRISNTDVAAACGLSRSHFVTAFRRATGETPHLCLLRYRVAKAKELLRGSMPISEIAFACGFADQSHLTRVFSKQTGVTPGEWRLERRHGNDLRNELATGA